jgi:hypothetical protein
MSGGECGHRRIALLKEGLVAIAAASWAEMLLTGAFPPPRGRVGPCCRRPWREAGKGQERLHWQGRPTDAALIRTCCPPKDDHLANDTGRDAIIFVREYHESILKLAARLYKRGRAHIPAQPGKESTP